MTKPIVIVTKYRDEGHLKLRDDGVLSIDALILHADLERAYFERLKPRIDGDLRTTMEKRFGELRDTDWNERTRKKHLLDKLPLRGSSSPTAISGPFTNQTSTSVNSPSLPPIISNTSITGFSDPNK
jgi:hypothetical protein